MRHKKQTPEVIPTWGWWTIGSFLGLIACTAIAISGIIQRMALPALELLTDGLQGIFRIAVILLFAGIYFLPTLIGRTSPRIAAIFATNLIFGWTGIGWAVALIWALAESGNMNKKPGTGV